MTLLNDEELDELLLKHIQKSPGLAVKVAVDNLQRAAFLLDHESGPVPAKDQRLVAGILVNARILYLYYNDSDSTVDNAVEEIVRSKAK